jgi:hypothetical protein
MNSTEYRNEFTKLLDIYKDSNMALNKNLVALMSKYIAELEPLQDKVSEYEEMINWMELNSNQGLCDYYNSTN